MDIQTILKSSEYFKFIQDIILKRGQWSPPTKYWEGHHIIPKCLGGEGHARSKHPNIIRLTAAEHFEAHRLLVELFPDNSKLAYAFWAMCTISNSAVIATPEEYQAAREARSKTIGKAVQTKLLGGTASEATRTLHSLKQSGDANGFYGRTHTLEAKQRVATARSKAVRHINTGIEYESSYQAAEALGISRVLINNCCRGKQAATRGGMQFEYVNSDDFYKGIPNQNTLTKYDRRREVIELRKQIVALDIQFPTVLAEEDKLRIRKLATCENKSYLLQLLSKFNLL